MQLDDERLEATEDDFGSVEYVVDLSARNSVPTVRNDIGPIFDGPGGMIMLGTEASSETTLSAGQNRLAQRAELEKLLTIKERLRRQQAKVKWIAEGDSNTKFFHGAIDRRRRRNGIPGIRIEGEWKEDVKEVKEGIRDYFENHFQSKRYGHFRAEGMDGSKLELEDQMMLEQVFELDEIKDAMMNCGLEKSPGPDGFNGHFFRSCWDVIKEDVHRVSKNFTKMASYATV